MKRLLWIMVLVLIGCGPTANQLAGEKAFYEAKVALSKAASSQPVFEMVSGDPGKPIVLENVSAIRVFQLPATVGGENLQQYQMRDFTEPWLRVIQTAVGTAAPWIGAWGIVHEVGKAAGATTSYSTNIGGTGNSATTTAIGSMGNITGNQNAVATQAADSLNTPTTTTVMTTNTDDHTVTTTVPEAP